MDGGAHADLAGQPDLAPVTLFHDLPADGHAQAGPPGVVPGVLHLLEAAPDLVNLIRMSNAVKCNYCATPLTLSDYTKMGGE